MTEYQATPEGNTIPMGQEITESQSQQGSGYINTSSQVPTQHQQEKEVESFQAQQDYQALQEKLGVNLDELQQQPPQEGEKVEEVPKQPTQEELQKLAQMKAQVDFMKKFNTKEGERFRNEFKDYMGVDPLDAFQSIHQTREVVQQLAAWKAQQENERAVSTLKQEWGDEFEPVWTEVRERFNKLPQHMKKALDNVEGARLLAAQIKTERLRNGGSHVPNFDRGGSTGVTSNIRNSGSPSGFIKTSDFFNDKVSEAEYVRALQQGRVIKDM